MQVTDFNLILKRFSDLESKIDSLQPVTPPSPIEIITQDELCHRLNITKPTAKKWERRGKIKSIRIGNSVRYNWPAVVAALQN